MSINGGLSIQGGPCFSSCKWNCSPLVNEREFSLVTGVAHQQQPIVLDLLKVLGKIHKTIHPKWW